MKLQPLCLIGLFLFAGGCGIPEGGGTHGTNRSAATSCPNSPAPVLMNAAICLCDGFSAVGRGLTTTAPNGGKANVAINGAANVVGRHEIAGGLWAYKGISGVGDVNVRDSVLTFGGVQGVGSVSVGKDLAVKGDLSNVGRLTVGGLLKVAGKTEFVGMAGTPNLAAFDAADAPPCSCDPSKKLDIAGKIADAKTSPNNNKLAEISSVGEQKLKLTTGSYYLAGGIHTVGDSVIEVEGAVALYVDGDIDSVGGGLFDVKAGSTLDLYVNGKVESVGKSVFTAAQPGSIRLFLGGAMPVLSAVGMQNLAVSIYAPDADLQLVGDTRIAGSIFARSISGVGHFQVDYTAPIEPAKGTCDGDPVQGPGNPGNPAGKDDVTPVVPGGPIN